MITPESKLFGFLYYPNTQGRIAINHLFEHCLGAYLNEKGEDFFTASNLFCTYVATKKDYTLFPLSPADLKKYIEHEKQRIFVEALEEFHTSIKLNELIRYKSDSFQNFMQALQNFTKLKEKIILIEFEKIISEQRFIKSTSEKLNADKIVETYNPERLPKLLNIPRFIKHLDTTEVALVYERSLSASVFTNCFNRKTEGLAKKLAVSHKFHKILRSEYKTPAHIVNIFSIKSLEGVGKSVLRSVLDELKNVAISDDDINRQKDLLTLQSEKRRTENTLTIPIIRSMIYNNGIIALENIEKIENKEIIKIQKNITYKILKDWPNS